MLISSLTDQGLYLSDGLEMRALPYYVVHTSVFAIIVTDEYFRESLKATEVCSNHN